MENLLTVDDSIRQTQIDKIKALKASRNNEDESESAVIETAARGTENLMPHILKAGSVCYACEIADVMRRCLGSLSNGLVNYFQFSVGSPKSKLKIIYFH